MSTQGEQPAHRAISDTILAFGKPLLDELPERTLDAFRQSLEVVVMVWNAHVMALPVWNHPEHLAHLHTLAEDEHAPGLRRALALLGERRAEAYALDARAVSKWDLVVDERGQVRFDCTAKLP